MSQAFLSSIEQIRQIEWDQEHLWDMRFPDAPSPLNRWFPAVEINDNLATVITDTIGAGTSDFQIPDGGSQVDVSVTYVDDEKLTITTWLEKWMAEISGRDTGFILLLTESVKPFDFIKMDKKRQIIKSATYYVYPVGTLTYRGSSQSNGSPQYTVNFIKAGKANSRT